MWQKGEISMSKKKTKKHPFYYEGMYWSSREQYAVWVQDQIIAVKAQKRRLV